MAGDLEAAYADAHRVLELEPGNAAGAHLMSGIAKHARPPSDNRPAKHSGAAAVRVKSKNRLTSEKPHKH